MVLWQNGTLTAMKNNIWIGLKDFHPSQHPVIRQYPVWIETLEKQMTLLQRVKILASRFITCLLPFRIMLF